MTLLSDRSDPSLEMEWSFCVVTITFSTLSLSRMVWHLGTVASSVLGRWADREVTVGSVARSSHNTHSSSARSCPARRASARTFNRLSWNQSFTFQNVPMEYFWSDCLALTSKERGKFDWGSCSEPSSTSNPKHTSQSTTVNIVLARLWFRNVPKICGENYNVDRRGALWIADF